MRSHELDEREVGVLVVALPQWKQDAIEEPFKYKQNPDDDQSSSHAEYRFGLKQAMLASKSRRSIGNPTATVQAGSRSTATSLGTSARIPS